MTRIIPVTRIVRSSKAELEAKAPVLHILRSYPQGQQFYKSGQTLFEDDMRVWEVVCAASASPLYFKEFRRTVAGPDGTPQSISYSDVGFGQTVNPTMAAFKEVTSLVGEDGIGTIVSLGTARSKRKRATGGVFRALLAHTDSDPASDDFKVQVAAHEKSFSYFRFDDVVGANVEIDEWEPAGLTTRTAESGVETMLKLEHMFHAWSAQMEVILEFKACAAQLVSQRRKRLQDADRWKLYATGVAVNGVLERLQQREVLRQAQQAQDKNHSSTSKQSRLHDEQGTNLPAASADLDTPI